MTDYVFLSTASVAAILACVAAPLRTVMAWRPGRTMAVLRPIARLRGYRPRYERFEQRS